MFLVILGPDPEGSKASEAEPTGCCASCSASGCAQVGPCSPERRALELNPWISFPPSLQLDVPIAKRGEVQENPIERME